MKIADIKGSNGKISGFNCLCRAPAMGPENPRGLCGMDVVCHARPGEIPGVHSLTFKPHFHLSVLWKRGFCPSFPHTASQLFPEWPLGCARSLPCICYTAATVSLFATFDLPRDTSVVFCHHSRQPPPPQLKLLISACTWPVGDPLSTAWAFPSPHPSVLHKLRAPNLSPWCFTGPSKRVPHHWLGG
jgi:hypothetical protein